MKTQLTEQQKKSVDQHNGFLEIDGGGSPYVVMSMPVYRDMMGVGSEEEYQASLRAIKEGLADVEAGRTRLMGDFFSEFDRKHGIQR